MNVTNRIGILHEVFEGTRPSPIGAAAGIVKLMEAIGREAASW
jgi:hypothetical protein